MDRDATSDELGRLADDLLDDIAAVRRHYADLRAALDGGGEEKPRSTVDDAELAVVSMALAGGTRDEVRRHLRDDFGIEDPDELLDRAPEPLPTERRRSRRRFTKRLLARR